MERPEQQKALSTEQEQQEQHEQQKQKLRSARAEAHGAIRAHAATQDRQRTSAENPNFVGDFFAASRLHFIGSWKTRFEQLLSTLPPPPPLPPLPAGSERTIMHVDMDCFFASVAARNRPALQGLPLAVSWSDNEHGAAEIASANYAARACGVTNGMWVSAAKQKCPELLILPYEFEAYASAAEDMYRAVLAITPHVMGISCDECYADATGCGEPAAMATQLRAAIARATGMPHHYSPLLADCLACCVPAYSPCRRAGACASPPTSP